VVIEVVAIWFTSDQHFGHANVVRFCNRPFQTLAEMHVVLIEGWQRLVKPDDTVYLLGDVFFCTARTAADIAKQLPGKVVLVQGNHDKLSASQYKSFGWTVVQDASIRLLGHFLTLSHFPYWPNMPDGLPAHDLRYPDRRPIDRGRWLLCGHVHNRWKTKDKMINVGVDVWNYAPVSLGGIDSIIKKASRSASGA
jgi:calcineurin-like phosphoesterase family protein